MAPRKKLKSAPPETVSTTVHDLPDSLLQHVLSFLPAQESVRTCVLARRWRHLWKSTTGLRILDLVLDDDEDISFQDLRKFVEHLLMLRERTDLESVEMKFHCYYEGESYVSLWTRFALICKVRVLTLHILGEEYFTLDGLPLVSRHLKTLDLYGLILQKSFLDFASCPALENLKMDVCKINGCKISSLSLKHLSITSCGCDLDGRLNVSTPGLVSLKLDRFSGKTPFLENMPLLQTACVNLGMGCEGVCLSIFCGGNKNGRGNCLSKNDGRIGELMGGISSAKHLALISDFGKFIFARDLMNCCPTFSKLKTLSLSVYWWEAPDLDPLACILQNSPVLEKLTLKLFSEGPDHEVEIKGRYGPMEGPSAISEHLNMVEIKCNVVDEKILKVLKLLSTFNIRFGFF